MKEEDKIEKQSDKNKAIEAALSQIDKQFGKGSVMKLGQKGAVVEVEAIPTGSISFDLALGIGGFPRGRVVEIYGPEATGKTTLACTSSPRPKAGGPGGLHRRRTCPGREICRKDRNRYRQPADLPARLRRTGPRDRRGPGQKRRGRCYSRRLGGRPRPQG